MKYTKTVLHHLCTELDVVLGSLKTSLLFVTKWAEMPSEALRIYQIYKYAEMPQHKKDKVPGFTLSAGYFLLPNCQRTRGRGSSVHHNTQTGATQPIRL